MVTPVYPCSFGRGGEVIGGIILRKSWSFQPRKLQLEVQLQRQTNNIGYHMSDSTECSFGKVCENINKLSLVMFMGVLYLWNTKLLILWVDHLFFQWFIDRSCPPCMVQGDNKTGKFTTPQIIMLPSSYIHQVL